MRRLGGNPPRHCASAVSVSSPCQGEDDGEGPHTALFFCARDSRFCLRSTPHTQSNTERRSTAQEVYPYTRPPCVPTSDSFSNQSNASPRSGSGPPSTRGRDQGLGRAYHARRSHHHCLAGPRHSGSADTATINSRGQSRYSAIAKAGISMRCSKCGIESTFSRIGDRGSQSRTAR
jgi:hypothetical protein